MTPNTMGRIQPADAKARRKALWLVGTVILFGFCLILAIEYFQHELQAWLGRNIEYLVDNPYVVLLATLLFVSPLFAAGIYLLVLGNRTVRAQRFPPPHYAV